MSVHSCILSLPMFNLGDYDSCDLLQEAFKTFTGFENSATVREATTLERPT